MEDWKQEPVRDPDQPARHRTILIVLTIVLVTLPLLLGALRLLGYI
jgi:hypothetical protein